MKRIIVFFLISLLGFIFYSLDNKENLRKKIVLEAYEKYFKVKSLIRPKEKPEIKSIPLDEKYRKNTKIVKSSPQNDNIRFIDLNNFLDNKTFNNEYKLDLGNSSVALIKITNSKKLKNGKIFVGADVLSPYKGRLVLQQVDKKISGHILFIKNKLAYVISKGNEQQELRITEVTKNDIVCSMLKRPENLNFSKGEIMRMSSHGSKFPLNSIPILHSDPSATVVIYLDFDGETVSNTTWNTEFTNGQPFYTKPWTLDDDVNSFTESELNGIKEIWEEVSDDFSLWHINVTTSLNAFNAAPTRRRVRVIITPNQSWLKGEYTIGGIAYLNTFHRNEPAFAFNRLPGDVSLAISHEVGHTFNLRHDGQHPHSGKSAKEYYGGHGTGETSWGPIMGAAYHMKRVQWSNGNYPHANNTEDDIKIISEYNEIDRRSDDHTSLFFSGKKVLSYDSNSHNNKGLIDHYLDYDSFRLKAKGYLNIEIEHKHSKHNLHPKVVISDTDDPNAKFNNVLLYRADDLRINRLVELPLESPNPNEDKTEKEYFLTISGGDSNTVNDYGSLGNYKIIIKTFSFGDVPREIVKREGESFSFEFPLQSKGFDANEISRNFGLLKDNRVIKMGTKLYIPKLSEYDSGSWQLFGNVGKYTYSHSLYLNVVYPPKLLYSVSSKSVRKGDSTYFSVSARANPEKITYVWKFNGSIINGNSERLELNNVQLSQAGTYTVEASNNVGTSIKSFDLIVRSKPEIIIDLNDTNEVVENSSFEIGVSVTGYPTPTYVWKKDGKVIEGQSGPKLLFNKINRLQSGVYTVTAKNSEGSITSKPSRVIVGFPPELGEYKKEYFILKDDSFTLTVPVKENPFRNTYTWTLDENPISNQESSNLFLSSVKDIHNGTYRLTVTNFAGSVTSEPIRLKVIEKPYFEKQPNSIKVDNYKKAELVVKANGNPTPTYQWYKYVISRNDDDLRETPSVLKIEKETGPKLIIDYLKASDEGIYYVVIKNRAGAVESDHVKIEINSEKFKYYTYDEENNPIELNSSAGINFYMSTMIIE